jgi:hypothetical protein
MPNESYTEELKTLRSVFPKGDHEIETIGLTQQRMDPEDGLDVVLVLDNTGSMSSGISHVIGSLAEVLSLLLGYGFSSVRFAVITFKDEGETMFLTDGLVTKDAAVAAMATIEASGGGDNAENGYGAIYSACEIEWRPDTLRVVLLVTDIDSHMRERSYFEVREKLLDSNVYLLAWYMGSGVTASEDNYAGLVSQSGGKVLLSYNAEDLAPEMALAIYGLAVPLEPPLYLVNDNRNLTATLETGETVTFLRRGFAINPFNSGEDGAISVTLTIDNSDLAASQYVNKAKRTGIPLEVSLRVYSKNQTSSPLNNPPLRLFVTHSEVKGDVVSCKLGWLDLINAPFPAEYYTPTRCPSLQ